MSPSYPCKSTYTCHPYWEKQVVLQNAESVPGDQDVEEEANMIKNSWEDLCKKNPLVLKELSKVKSYVA